MILKEPIEVVGEILCCNCVYFYRFEHKGEVIVFECQNADIDDWDGVECLDFCTLGSWVVKSENGGVKVLNYSQIHEFFLNK